MTIHCDGIWLAGERGKPKGLLVGKPKVHWENSLEGFLEEVTAGTCRRVGVNQAVFQAEGTACTKAQRLERATKWVLL